MANTLGQRVIGHGRKEGAGKRLVSVWGDAGGKWVWLVPCLESVWVGARESMARGAWLVPYLESVWVGARERTVE